MDLSAISSVVQTIGGLLAREVTSLMDVKEQVEDLQKELIWMQSFLKDADTMKVETAVMRTSVAEIRELAYDAEDLIETFALKVALRRKRGFSNVIKRSACILNEGWLLCQTKSEIEKITAKITKLTRRLQTYDVKKSRDEAGSSSSNQRRESRRPYPHTIDDNVVGLEDDIKKLVSVLVDDESDCRVVSICGMGGLGKTTLAKKIYRHGHVIEHFNCLAWVFVSQQFQVRRVWEDILSGLTSIDERVNKPITLIGERGSRQSDEELSARLFNHLKDNKCLVILDDVWSIEAWDSLKHAFPGAKDTSSKFFITSRHKEVASHADRRGYLHELQCLKEEESWKLFQKIAFPQVDPAANMIDAKMEELGKSMVHHCAGLPLAIIVLGGILATKNSAYEWKMVSENIKSYLNRGKGQCTEEVLALSYDDLPPYLRPCFLYFSHFPEDYVIDADRLIELWVAEGIVSSNGGEIMEDCAERCLEELVERCMVQVVKRGASFKIRSCRMHDLMRDLCLSIAKKENFVCIIDDPSFSQSVGRAVRRIAAHRPSSFWCIKSSTLRSIVLLDDQYGDEYFLASFHPKMRKRLNEMDNVEGCYSISKIMVLGLYLFWEFHASWKFLLNNFKLLRVLEFDGNDSFGGCKLPSAIGNLIHLRFLNLSNIEFIVQRIPSSLGNLRYLQTLDLRCPAQRIPVCVANVIWKLEELRHLYLPREMSDKTKLKLHSLRNLLTLANFNTTNCFAADLSKLTNLRVLSIYGSLNIQDFKEVLDKEMPIIGSKYLRALYIFTYEGKIDPKLFHHLLSSCVNLCDLILEGEMEQLPDYQFFSSNVTYIDLKWCNLLEDPMPTLEKLPNLRVLKLKTGAITGKEMLCSASRFPKLEALVLKGLETLEELRVEDGAMSALRGFKIENCSNLKKLPDGLRSIKTLQEIKIQYMAKDFKDKLVQGGEDFYKVEHVPSIKFSKMY